LVARPLTVALMIGLRSVVHIGRNSQKSPRYDMNYKKTVFLRNSTFVARLLPVAHGGWLRRRNDEIGGDRKEVGRSCMCVCERERLG